MLKLIKSLLEPSVFLVTAIVYTLLITVGSLVSSNTLPKLDYPVSDKLVHFVGYCFLVVVWFLYAVIKFKKVHYLKTLLLIAVASFIYGIIIEVLQGEVVLSRQADIKDVLANSMGILFAVIVFFLLQKKILILKSKN